ncbi:hypothetical protein [Microbacterium sp. ZXX196]|uniref:hypothetical protein n=1 Tax=Microbacterium sp. ZXX196 TaxID=2609291 RepID=UPI0012B93C09|nr:hypothetical protein [Microbacterium sp. ZXX196]MTE24857.1 hypothetical protein [Microbacterium sp. ZXX196]
MARIRTIKPEFWRSPSTAAASPWARLLFIAMWSWADDYGRAEWTPRELLGFAFPHDSESPCTDADFPRLLAEVRDAFEVEFYTNRGRRFYEIPSWSEHQKTERRAGDKFPRATDPDSSSDQGIPGGGGTTAESGGFSSRSLGKVPPGTGEQGNRGKGTGEREQGKRAKALSSEVAEATPRHDVEELLDLLDAEIEANGAKKPKRNKANRDAIRLMLDRDHIPAADIAGAIRWSAKDTFWRSNILSASKLREKYDQLRLDAQRKSGGGQKSKAAQNADRYREEFGDEYARSVPALDAGFGV